MTERLITKILLGLGGIIVLAGIVAVSLYNYKILMAIQPEVTPQPPALSETRVMSIQATTAHPVVIDPNNDPLAPVRHVNIAPSPRSAPAEGTPVFSKTYETPLKSPVLVQ